MKQITKAEVRKIARKEAEKVVTKSWNAFAKELDKGLKRHSEVR